MSASSHRQLVQQLLAEHGTTYASEAGITLRDKPAPLFRLLVLCQLFAAPISAGIAVRAARELFDAGWRTPLRQFPRVGPESAGIFCREVQDVWPSVRPYLDDEVRAGARAAGLPDDPDCLAALVDEDDLARFGSALVRVALAG